MSQQLVPTYLLSVAIVAACAVAFYRSEAPRDPAAEKQGRSPGPNASRPPSEGKPVVGRDVALASPAPPPARPAVVAPPVVRAVARRVTAPKGSFARVEPGESLPDVARRVYGPAARVADLWRANRDQLPAADAPLRPGMLLRTP